MSTLSIKRRVSLLLAALALLGAVLGSVGLLLVQRWNGEPVSIVVFVASSLLLIALLSARGVRWALRPLVGASTVVEALRDDDFSLRLRQTRLGGLDELAHSVNLLAEHLRGQSLDQRESGLLLVKVLDEIDLPVLAFRDDGVLTLSNPAARRLIGLELHAGVTDQALGVAGLRGVRPDASVRLILPGGAGRFVVRERNFRLGGVPHRLLVLAEVGGVLSSERNEAWQGLVRVMSHEINNSLSPIKSLAESWRGRLQRDDANVDAAGLGDSLDLIARRAASLSRFVGIYASLARLPEPDRRSLRIDRLAAKAAALETRVPVRIIGVEGEFNADPDQLEQALINMIRNAAEACVDADAPEVIMDWTLEAPRAPDLRAAALELRVLDNGPGPPPSENLFVPFFSTKPDGSGIGMLLVRRIAELHGGDFELLPREDVPTGAVARMWLSGSVQ